MSSSDSESTLSGPLSVPLPRKSHNPDGTIASQSPNKPPIWAIERVASDVAEPAPLPAKCSMHDREDGVCCRELRNDDERTLINPDVVRDVVIGLSDGLTVPFALAAGLSSLGESKLVVLGGFAELIAGAISMGIGGFLASQAERDSFLYLRRATRKRVRRSCEGELEREVLGVLGPVGVDEKTAREVARCLREVEVGSAQGLGDESDADTEVRSRRSADEEEGQQLRFQSNVGITAFLMKFGEGMEEVPSTRMYTSALTIGLGYLFGGLIPLLPYFFEPVAHIALIYSCIVTGLVLLVFGAVKARVTGATNGAWGYAWGAVSTLLVGGAAAGAAYGLVALLENGEGA